MRTICLYFEIHQIIHLKRYRFFDIGTDHYYYDDYANETGMNEVAERSYIPALSTLIEMVKNSGGAFKVYNLMYFEIKTDRSHSLYHFIVYHNF